MTRERLEIAPGVFADVPRPASGHMPFDGHRTVAEVYAPCSVCDEVRATPCGFERCPKALPELRRAHDHRPVAVLRWTDEGELQLGMFGDGCRMLVIDERVPHDRVYEVTHREPLNALELLVPDGTEIGHAGDARHTALVARMEAMFAGKPHLRPVDSDQGSSAA